ncbi:hypothetical protein MYX77_03515 [Acidobacteriia bacterium AH_259_A11_L15]|nr:hypothetical protein [Acidobacteriia bacterium AH_259_A11_L15]
MELTEAHIARLRALLAQGFAPISFPLFPACLGVGKYGCAALLRPVGADRLEKAAPPSLLIEGNLSVLVERGGGKWFVWKSHQVVATAERLGALRRFEEELERWLAPPV